MQITYTFPARRTILQFSQIRFTLDRTFISCQTHRTASIVAISISRTISLGPGPNLVTIRTRTPIRKSGGQEIGFLITRTLIAGRFALRLVPSLSIFEISQYPRSARSHGHRVLKVSAESAILGLDRPTVG